MPPRTRLAPSPTGALHLGNVRTFVVNWLLARQQGWHIVLRIDDLDGPRVRPGSADEAIDLLRWLGLDWDEGPYYQSRDLSPYREALLTLKQQGHAYPCRCSRSEILAASLSAPHAGEHELRYAGTCRINDDCDAVTIDDPTVGWRVRVPDETEIHVDQFSGPFEQNTQRVVGDFLIATKGAIPSYQLAVVVDDARQGIDRVVRGDDLLGSTPRQALLRRALGLEPEPLHWHLPLVVGADGRRLAKRHGDTRVATYRQAGVRPDRLLGLVAHWIGLDRREYQLAQLLVEWDIAKMPRIPAVFVDSDHDWLCQRT